jgi:acetyl-CoA acetyltransferase family protein
MTDVYLFDALRTPRTKGKPDGSLATVPPYELVRQLVAAISTRDGAAVPAAIERIALGCVTQVGPQGGHIALISRILSGLPDTAVAVTLNNYCVSGMSAVASAARAIATGEERLALAGGVESMSQSLFEGDQATFYTDRALAERLTYVSPPIVADWLATEEGLTREQLDAVTVESHSRAGIAWAEGRYATTVVPVERADGTRVERDELVRPRMVVGDLARFGAAFGPLGESSGADAFLTRTIPGLKEMRHLHAIPHCPPIADGAALVLLGSLARGAELGLKPRARLAYVAEVDTDLKRPFAPGFVALERLLTRSGLALRDLGAIEFMEAFAAVPAKFRRDYDVDPERVNASGGHLAMGHPMGASGAILIATLLAEMERKNLEWGAAIAHAVSGVGCGVLLQRDRS